MGNLSRSEYAIWLKAIKQRIVTAQLRTARAANRELVVFYWQLGESISIELIKNDWGSKIIDQLSTDLSREFPNIKGFSRRNLYYMKRFYEFFVGLTDKNSIVPQSGAQLESVIVPQAGAQLAPVIIQQICGQLPSP